MPRWIIALLAAAVAVLVPTPALAADPSPSPSAGSESSGSDPSSGSAVAIGPEVAGTPGCTVPGNDVTGVAVTPAGTAVISGVEAGGLDHYEITTIDASCNATSERWDLGPYDPTDLLWHDGKFYVCDCGLTDQRASIAVVEVTPDQVGGDIYRFSTEDVSALDVNAMVLDGNGLPVFFDSVADSQATVIYTAPAWGTENARPGPALTQAGQFTPPATPGSGSSGSLEITGAAVSPDGSRLVLRTATDAYEYAVTGGDIVGALLNGAPVVTPLHDEVSALSITYSADGTQFISAPYVADAPLLTFARYVPPAPSPSATAESTEGPTPAGDGGSGLVGKLTKPPYLYGEAGLVVLIVLIVIISAVSRRRRRRRDEEDWRGGRGRRGNSGDGFIDYDDRGPGPGPGNWGPPPQPAPGWGPAPQPQPQPGGWPPQPGPGGWSPQPQPGPGGWGQSQPGPGGWGPQPQQPGPGGWVPPAAPPPTAAPGGGWEQGSGWDQGGWQ